MLIPVTFALAALPVAAGDLKDAIKVKVSGRGDFEVFVVAYLACLIGLFLFLHFGFHDASLTLPYYIVYFVPGCVLAIIMFAGEAWRRGGRFFGDAIVYGVAGLITLGWLARPAIPALEIASSFSFWLVVAAVHGAAAASRRFAIGSVVLLAGAAFLGMCIYQTDLSRFAPSDPKPKRGNGTYSAAQYSFSSSFARTLVQKEPIGFWYTGDPKSF